MNRCNAPADQIEDSRFFVIVDALSEALSHRRPAPVSVSLLGRLDFYNRQIWHNTYSKIDIIPG